MGAVYAKCCKNKSYDNNNSSGELHNSRLPTQTIELGASNQISTIQSAIKFGKGNNLRIYTILH